MSLLRRLQMLQLADSALPVGSLAQSFGMETLVEEHNLSSDRLFEYIEGLLEESLLLDAVYCRVAHERGASGQSLPYALSEELSALRPARESRCASLSLGRRFLRLVLILDDLSVLDGASLDVHFCIAFGFACGLLGMDKTTTVASFLHQGVSNIISAAQRLMPLGQMEAGRMAWHLKPRIVEAARQAGTFKIEDAPCFSPLPELGSLRHPRLATRLFIS